MKKITRFKKIYLVEIVSVLLLCLTVSSCKKKDEMKASPSASEEKNQTAKVSNDSLIKFLSITLDVKKTEIDFNPTSDEFIVRGKLKFSRTEIEDRYNHSNVYQTIYGK